MNNHIKQAAIRLAFSAFVAGLLSLLLWTSFLASADTVTVCPSGCDYTSIQAAVDAVNPYDTINVLEGTFLENVTINKSLTLRGAGAEDTIIDGNGTGRVIAIEPGLVVTITDISVVNGSSLFAPGILNPGDLYVKGVIMRNNTTFCCNSVGGGGIANMSTGVATLVGTKIMDNHVVNNGGGIYNAGTMTVSESIITGNYGLNGGGIFVDLGGRLFLNESTISNNPGNNGSAIRVSPSGTITVTNSTLSENGGWVTVYTFGDAVFLNSTIANNAGFGLRTWGGEIRLHHTIVANNAPDDCEAVAGGSIISLDYNIASDDTCPLEGPNDQPNTDPQLGPLADNGGNTWTHALLPGSPAIDAGNPDGCIDSYGNLLTMDQRGYARPEDGDGDGIPVCDVGSVEIKVEPNSVMLEALNASSGNPLELGPLPLISVVTVAGFVLSVGYWVFRIRPANWA